MTYDELRELLNRRLDPKTTPGIPFMSKGSTNEEVFGYVPLLGYGQTPAGALAIRELLFQVESRKQRLSVGEHRECDPINLFVKTEPHKASKVKDGAWRLIHGVSVVDQVIAMRFWEPLIDSLPGKWGESSCMIGWTPQKGGYKWLYERFCQTHQDVSSADKSSWDWTWPEWLNDVVCHLLIDLRVCSSGVEQDVMRNYIHSMLGPRELVYGKFSVTTQQAGIMSSGWLFTIFLNSVAQYCLHWVASRLAGEDPDSGLFVAMGDDTLQTARSSEYWKKLSSLGCILKEVKTVSASELSCYSEGWDFPAMLEFCGTIFNYIHSVPAYAAKHAFALHFGDDELFESVLTSYQYLYAHSDALSLVQERLADLNPRAVVPPDQLKAWYDGQLDLPMPDCVLW